MKKALQAVENLQKQTNLNNNEMIKVNDGTNYLF